MEPETKRILSLLNTIFEKNAWHGPAVKEVLNQIQEKEAFRRLAQTHSIIELVAHMTAWRRYVTEKLKCNPGYPVTEEMNFPHPQNWKETVRELETSQHELMKALEDFPEEKTPYAGAGKNESTDLLYSSPRDYSSRSLSHRADHAYNQSNSNTIVLDQIPNSLDPNLTVVSGLSIKNYLDADLETRRSHSTFVLRSRISTPLDDL